MILRWPEKKRVLWLLLAIGFMFTSAYSMARLLGIIALVSAWTGGSPYEHQVPELQRQGEFWWLLALASPFVAALLLGFGKSKTLSSYLWHLALSALGILGFGVGLFLIGWLLS